MNAIKPIIILFILIHATYSCTPESTKNNEPIRDLYQHSFESENELKDNFFEKYNLSKDFKRTGDYSIKVNPKNPVGFLLSIPNCKFGDSFTASIWRKKGSSNGTISIKTNKTWSRTSKDPIKRKNGWEKLEVKLDVISKSDDLWLQVYVSNTGDNNNPTYFDDLTLTKTVDGVKASSIKADAVLSIDFINYQQLKNLRDSAFQNKIISKSNKKWMKAKLNEMDIMIRLKGDWADHVVGQKWSLRVKDKNKILINNGTYSINRPEARNYLNEWVFHEMLKKEQIITTNYSFKLIRLNNLFTGVYAVEEHFNDQFLKNNNRKGGTILKFDESELWNMRLKNNSEKLRGYPFFDQAPIKAYKSEANGDNNKAKTILEQFRRFDKTVVPSFDLDKTAKFLALTDIHYAYHGWIWHNLRFYFNNGKMEIIAYDGCSIKEPLNDEGDAFFSNKNSKFSRLFFTNAEFCELYFKYLNYFSSEKYLNEFFQANRTQLQQYSQLIQLESPDYKYDKEKLINRGKRIKSQLKNINVSRFIENSKELKFLSLKTAT